MAEVRLAEAVAALSLAIDIGMGQPLEQGLRTCLVATGLARKVGVDEDDTRRVFYLALLRHVGCTAESDLAADLLGDEIAFRRGAVVLDFTKPSQMFPYMVRNVGAGKSVAGRARHVGKTLANSKRFLASMDSVCETAQLLATRLGFDAVVQQGLWQIFERWDGKGLPGRVGGEEIVLPARFIAIAELFEGLCRLEGPDRAVAVVGDRRGTAFAPEVADCLCREAGTFLPFFEQASVWDDVLAAEPSPRRALALSDEQLEDVLAAVADFTDLKSTYTLGHSRGVADLAAAAAPAAGLSSADATNLRRAGLVHDIGRVGISAAVWGKRGALSRDEWEKVRLHPYYTERVLTRPPALARLGELASTHHERLDGGGYHRALPASVLPRPARVLAAADGYRARIEERPHRPAMAPEAAAASLRDDVREGRLDADAVDAVLQASGQGGGRRRRTQVAGLTDREIEVLALVAAGQSIKEIARTLTISPKTADAHIQHIYTKLGVSTRAGATLFAVEHGLVDRARDRETSR
ncbi:MAG TPA: HD domain-containing phosphohydrolase [Acidimicrobiales bacterium]|nr:HD domain-containing phosphohydrolase [Acidimicrobiales bacterium]